MRVGLDAYLLHGGHDYRAAGVSVYTGELLGALVRFCPQHDYCAFVGPDAPSLDGLRAVVAPVHTERAPIRIIWEQVALPLESARRRLDLLHGAVNVIPLLSGVPSVVTIHDLAFLRHPDRFPAAKAAYLRAAVRWSVGRARRVIAVSNGTRDDLVELLGVHPDRVDVIYSGVGERFHPASPEGRDGFRQRALGGRPYILHVGTLEPRKNLDVLIRAYAAARDSHGIPHVLVLVGARGWMYQQLFSLVQQLRLQEHVRFLDYVPGADLPLWYTAADLFAYPSAYEGFGLPVLEAMASGVPVIISTTPALREIAGEAGVSVEPGSQEALHEAMIRILGDPCLQDRLRRAGLARAAEFSWRRTAERTVETYARATGRAA